MQRHAVSYLPGPWTLLTNADPQRSVVLLADVDPAGPVLPALWEALERGAGIDGVLGVIVREGLRTVPSFAIAEQTPDGTRVLVSGKARAEVAATGTGEPQVLAAAEAPTWLDQRWARADGVRLTVGDGPDDAGPRLPLAAGVAFAAAVTIGTIAVDQPHATPSHSTGTGDATQYPPPVAETGVIDALPWQLSGDFRFAPQSQRQPEASPQPQAPPQAQPLAPPRAQPPAPASEPAGNTIGRARLAAQRQPGEPAPPTVLATVCPNRHLGPPHAGTCRICGQPVPQQDPISVPRPVLGVMNLSSGDRVPLDRDIVLGRAPSVTDSQPSLRPHVVQLAGAGDDISRTHLRITLEGWHVQAVDLGSTNGTIVTLPGQQPVRLRPHDPFTIVPGTLVSLADEVTLRYEVTA